jgi:tetratricopeptide (TPR) repeat protein
MGILFGVFTLWLEKHVKGASGPEFALPFLDRFLVAGRSFWFSLGKLVWPARLTFIYPRWQIDATSVGQYLYPLGAIVLLATLWWARRWLGRAPFAAMVYFTLAFPALVLVEVLYMMRYTFVADHWQYLGSMSVIALGASGAVLALDRWAHSYRRIGPVIGAVVLTGLGLLTWRQGHIYYNRETLWRDTLAKNPGCWMAHIDLGDVLLKQNKVSEAMGEYEWALQINPDYAEARYNLGVALEETGRVPEAIGSFEEALKLKPDYAEAHNNLGVALARQRKFAEAIAEITAAVRLNPDYADAHYNIAILLAKQGKIDDAIAHLQRALKLEPGREDFRRKFNELLQVDARPQIQ